MHKISGTEIWTEKLKCVVFGHFLSTNWKQRCYTSKIAQNFKVDQCLEKTVLGSTVSTQKVLALQKEKKKKCGTPLLAFLNWNNFGLIKHIYLQAKNKYIPVFSFTERNCKKSSWSLELLLDVDGWQYEDSIISTSVT